MKALLNPFPDYPVISLDDDSGDVSGRTIPTPAIQRARELTRGFLDGWQGQLAGGDPAGPLIVAVRGDYGSGKTHLLVDAEAQVAAALGRDGSAASSTMVPCIETDPIGWYRSTAACRFDLAVVKQAVVHLYSLAGADVAEQVKLTKAAAKRLESDPNAIFELIKENLLSASAVEARFLQRLGAACPDAGADTRAALTGLLWGDTFNVSSRWLCAESLSETERDGIGVLANLDSDEAAAEVIVAFAGLLSHTGRLFVLVIDELEHLRRRDTVTGSKRNITWLKRLLQSLAANPVLVFVSGHWSAWEETSDYLERFSPDSTIDIHSLDGTDVVKIFSARVPDVDLDPKIATAIARAGGGNIRRILSLARVLYDESSGFSQPVTQAQIKDVAGRVSKRVSAQDALLKIYEIFEGEGFSVGRESEVGDGVRFPIVVSRGDRPEIVVELKHSVTPQTLIKRLRRFVEQLTELRRTHPDLVGYFVSDGAGDPEVRSILDSDQAEFIRFFDLATPSGLAALADRARRFARREKEPSAEARQLQTLLERSGRLEEEIKVAQASEDVDVIARLEEQRKQLNRSIGRMMGEADKRDAELQEQIKRLEEKRSQEFGELQKRLAELSSRFESTRDRELVAPREEEAGTRLQLAYEDLKRPPSLSTRLNAVFTGRVIWVLALALVFYLAGLGLSFFDVDTGPQEKRIYNLEGEFSDLQRSVEETPLGSIEYQDDLALMRELSLLIEQEKETLGHLEQSKRQIVVYRWLSNVLAIAAGVFALWLFLRGWMKVDRYLDFRARSLRHVYLRSEDLEDLLKAEQFLQQSLDAGPFRAQELASEQLSRALPKIFGYLSGETSDGQDSALSEAS